MSTPRILVVDDDMDLRMLVGDFLVQNGMAVERAANAKEMDALLRVTRFDLIILDLMMPGEDGLSVLRRIRAADRPAIIMLSAMGEDTDRIIGLEVGADDYLAKPCNPRELLARVRAVLRRRVGGGASERRFGTWMLDLVARTIIREESAPTALTGAEFRVLNALLDKPQAVLTRDQLIEAVKGTDSDVFDRTIDMTIFRLRKKLGRDDPIRTIRGEGYMFTLKVTGA